MGANVSPEVKADMTVEELCEEIAKKRIEFYSRDLGPWAKNNMTASDIGECQRESVLAIREWGQRPAFNPEIKARLERGNAIENLALAELAALGYQARVERKPFEIKNDGGQLLCRGRLDGFLEKDNRTFPFECKSLNPNVYNQINEQVDFDRYFFFRKYPKQLQTYLYANNLDEGFWILDDCMGHWKLIPCRLDYNRMEAILQHLEVVADHLEAKTLPDFHKDPSTCLKCWARGRICNPPFFGSEGMQLIKDPELEQKLDRRADLDLFATEYDHLDKELKELLKETMKPEQVFIIGKWMVKAEEKQRNFKAQSAKAATTTTYLGFDIEPIEEKTNEI